MFQNSIFQAPLSQILHRIPLLNLEYIGLQKYWVKKREDKSRAILGHWKTEVPFMKIGL